MASGLRADAVPCSAALESARFMSTSSNTPSANPTAKQTNSEQPSSQRTPLFDLHVELGARMVDFAGWQMPLQYAAGIMTEHTHCRNNAALFDVSHMGQLRLSGESAAQMLETVVPCDVVNLPVGKARYTFFTNPQGGILDDLIISNAGDHFYIVVNASMRDQDVAHLREHLGDCQLEELTGSALIALQGPKAAQILGQHCEQALSLNFMETVVAPIAGIECRVSRLGYTGEDGFEISIPQNSVVAITKLLLQHEHCMPAGLGARDSLRLEAGLSLYGHEITTSTTPVEASLGWAIQKRRRAEGGFPGADIINQQFESGTTRKLVGLKLTGRVPARQGAQVCNTANGSIGEVTSGGFGPTVEAPVAIAYVEAEYASQGTDVLLSIRGKSHPAVVCALPFVPNGYKR